MVSEKCHQETLTEHTDEHSYHDSQNQARYHNLRIVQISVGIVVDYASVIADQLDIKAFGSIRYADEDTVFFDGKVRHLVKGNGLDDLMFLVETVDV